MTDYEKLWDFLNLWRAHKVARLGKRSKVEVINFELDLAANLSRLSESIRNNTYTISGYYEFIVHDPKERCIHALHYADRVVQHCLCDEVLEHIIDKRLIYDNAACRKGKGTHFALNRLSRFLREYFHRYGTDGWCLKCDIKKFFDNIDHIVLKEKLAKIIIDQQLLYFLYGIIDSYNVSPHKGLPLGNQSSQWLAIYYLDCLDRLIKERLSIHWYTRYMDDCVLVHNDRSYLKYCLSIMENFIKEELKLEFNNKTQIFPLKNGVDYLGWHFYLTETGKVIRKLRRRTKKKFKHRLCDMEERFSNGKIDAEDITQVVNSYIAHISHGNTWRLKTSILKDFSVSKKYQ